MHWHCFNGHQRSRAHARWNEALLEETALGQCHQAVPQAHVHSKRHDICAPAQLQQSRHVQLPQRRTTARIVQRVLLNPSRFLFAAMALCFVRNTQD